MSRVTIKDIARISGCSKTTVSFALNDPSRISTRTRDKIVRIADELGYVPDPVARSLSLKRQQTIGLLLPEVIADAFLNPHLSEVVRGIGAVCERHGFTLTLIPPIRASLAEGVRGAAVDGLITVGLGPGSETLECIERRHLPFVAIDERFESDVPVVGIDDTRAAATIMRHVLALGHRDIVIVAFGTQPKLSVDPRVATDRMAGYHEALRAVDPALVARTAVVSADVPSLDGGRAVVQTLAARRPLPTAFVAMSDILAIGIMTELQAATIAVPQAVTVVGFDDIPESRLVRPQLTTIRQPGYEKGLRAAESLMALIDHTEYPRHICLDAVLTVRESSAAPAPPTRA